MASNASSNVTNLIEHATPQSMASAGVPFALARWYHVTGRHLRRFTDWDVERIMDVRLRLAQSGV